MAPSANHRGWLNSRDRGILAAVYNGAQGGARVLDANTALSGVLAGTPVALASPVDCLFISNTVANGDIALFTLIGGSNSTEILRIDTSAGSLLINDGSVDLDVRVESNNMQYAVYVDAGKDGLVLGSNTDTSSADQLITVSRAARTATANTAYYDLRIAPAGAVTVPTGTTAVVATASLVEPNVTATGTVTRAATLHIASQPTEGGTANAAILFGAAANIAGTTSITINDDSEDLDVRVESNNMQYALYVDGAKDSVVIGSNTDTSSADQLVNITRAARTATASTNYYDLSIAAAGAVTVPTGTTAVVASLRVTEPNITATGTVTAAATVYVADAPTEGGSNYALWVDSGATRLDGNLDMSSAGLDLVIIPNTAVAFEVSDGTTKLMTWDTRNTVTVQNLLIDAPASQTLPNAGTSQFRNVSVAAHTVTLVGATQVTTVNQGAQLWIGAPTYNQSGGAVTVDQVSTLHIAAPVAGTSVTITANRLISTSVTDCYLTAAGVWTDTACTQKVKQDIEDLDYATMPHLLEMIRPVAFKYDPEKLGSNDLGRQRYGVIAEELPDFLRLPGDVNPSAISGSILGAFSLAGLRYLYDRLVRAEAKLAALSV